MDRSHKRLLADLVGFKTITPHGSDAIDYCANFLEELGFVCTKLQCGDVSNLYAKLGRHEKNLCFAGHIDVVPPLDNWATDPFTLTEKDGRLYGRGTNDMKGPLSSCLMAIKDFVTSSTSYEFSLSLILTSDEEIGSKDGTRQVVEFLRESNEKITGCVLCESCSNGASGEYVKVGCRGSLNVDFISYGYQGHVVNGKVFGNHLHSLVQFLHSFTTTELDSGSETFAPSDVELTSIDVGNYTRNVIPQTATARLNIRFNNHWSISDLEAHIISQTPDGITATFERLGYPFIGSREAFTEFVRGAVGNVIGKLPDVGTDGGNSDALSIREITDVVEVGAQVSGAHIVDEFITEADLTKLRNIYLGLMTDFHKLEVT
ncbi:MAG: succinyl-diaminopimelate desuccinylase [Holosporales bacterium]|jgi:succinyl-diaminopimelate desuccinylase|nr:succinyl-diaminopimelate desuccinylase [Holosporales bacterium]